MERIIAYCGLVCSDCDAYIATQAGDAEALERVAAEWTTKYHAPSISGESVLCDGCPDDQGHKWVRCAECPIRACAIAAGVRTCAACGRYPCATLLRFFDVTPSAWAMLDGLRPQD